MRDIVKDLRHDHRRFTVLLNILEGEVRHIDDESTSDLDLVTGVIEYFSGYPETSHHPKEELLYVKLRDRLPEASEGLAAIEKDHQHSAAKIAALKKRCG